MNNQKGNLLYLFSLLLTFIWAVGFYGHQTGGAFHLILAGAVITAYSSIWKVDKILTLE